VNPSALGEFVGKLAWPKKFSGAVASIAHPWSPASIRSRLPAEMEVTVEYSVSGIYRPRPDVNAGHYFRKTMSAEEALLRIAFNREFGYYVYIAQADLEDYSESIGGFIPDLRDSQGRPPARRLLFIGGQGTGTHAHYDLPDNLMMVLAGSKSITFFSPAVSKLLRPFASPLSCCNVSSRTDSEVMALVTSLDRNLAFDMDVEQGDAVYIPSGWWHRVTNFGFAVCVSHFWVPSLRRRMNWHFIRVKIARS
jgi:hypothetical protein